MTAGSLLKSKSCWLAAMTAGSLLKSKNCWLAAATAGSSFKSLSCWLAAVTGGPLLKSKRFVCFGMLHLALQRADSRNGMRDSGEVGSL